MTETPQEQIERLTMQRNEAREIYSRSANSWRSITDDLMAKHAAEKERLRDALFSATASLAGAASAYRNYAKRHKLHGTAETDAVFSTRVNDFDKAVNSARAALAAKP